MKVVGINGSTRKDGNTAIIIKKVFDELKKDSINTELIQFAGKPLHGCTGCGACFKTRNNRCIMQDDMFNEYMQKLIEADGIILGSPVYFSDVTAEMKAFIDRAGMVANANGGLLKYKAGAAVMAVRRGGATHAFDTMNHFLHYMQMFLVGGSYWNMVYGREIGEVENDKEGLENMRVIGENMTWLLHHIAK
ncbi:flavodoxin family protein [Pectinatus frisingensis]|uniref:flavodoxin family protein n=1 Tax=Pectinatus frisingensis TaxID=865 RepID=UPI003D8008B7